MSDEELTVALLLEEYRRIREKYTRNLETSFYVAEATFLVMLVGSLLFLGLYLVPIIDAEYTGFRTLFSSLNFVNFVLLCNVVGMLVFGMVTIALKQRRRVKRRAWRANRWTPRSSTSDAA